MQAAPVARTRPATEEAAPRSVPLLSLPGAREAIRQMAENATRDDLAKVIFSSILLVRGVFHDPHVPKEKRIATGIRKRMEALSERLSAAANVADRAAIDIDHDNRFHGRVHPKSPNSLAELKADVQDCFVSARQRGTGENWLTEFVKFQHERVGSARDLLIPQVSPSPGLPHGDPAPVRAFATALRVAADQLLDRACQWSPAPRPGRVVADPGVQTLALYARGAGLDVAVVARRIVVEFGQTVDPHANRPPAAPPEAGAIRKRRLEAIAAWEDEQIAAWVLLLRKHGVQNVDVESENDVELARRVLRANPDGLHGNRELIAKMGVAKARGLAAIAELKRLDELQRRGRLLTLRPKSPGS